MSSDQSVEAAAACVEHAASLVKSARAVLETGEPNIAYHLAVLALEEIGKRQLLLLNHMAVSTGKLAPFNDRQNTDHQKKLFWCFFGGLLTTNKIDPSAFRVAESLAETLHSKRMAGLYVDISKDGVSVPKNNIDTAEAENLVSLAEARLKLALSETLRETLPEDEVELQAWFLSATDVPETRNFIFAKTSLAKLAELDDVPSWARWIRAELEKLRQSEREATALELARQRPIEGKKPKWRIRFRLNTVTHSIRVAPLKIWNAAMLDIQFSPVERKPQLIVDMTLHDGVPVAALYPFGWDMARHLTVALNLATLGTWWWHFADDTSRWYERIDDLDNKDMQVVFSQGEEPLDWGRERKVLDDAAIRRLMAVIVALPMPEIGPREATFTDHYAGGIAELAASNVHLPRYAEAIMRFLTALRMLMVQRGDVGSDEPLEPAFMKFVMDRGAEFEEQEDVLGIIRAFDTARRTGKSSEGPMPRATHAGIIKAFVSWYYMELIQPTAFADVKDKFKKASAAS